MTYFSIYHDKDVNIEKNIGNFFKQTILYNILAMNGLVSGYGSDSDDEEVTSDIKKSKDEGKTKLRTP